MPPPIPNCFCGLEQKYPITIFLYYCFVVLQARVIFITDLSHNEIIDYCINSLVHGMIENSYTKIESAFSSRQVDLFKCLALPDQQHKTKR